MNLPIGLTRVAVSGALFSTMAVSAVAGVSASFEPGQIYLVSNSIPADSNSGLAITGVLRIEPLSGSVTLLTELPSFFGAGAASHDPFRDRLVVRIGVVDLDLRLIDANGVIEPLPTTFEPLAKDVAPAGDGRIFLLSNHAIGWIDAVGATHLLLDETGDQPFDPQLSPLQSSFIYDAGTNALIIADTEGTDSRVLFVELSDDGTRVEQPITSVSVVGSTATTETVVGLSAMPDGDLLLAIDDNSNSLQPRLQRVDPVTRTVTPFASCEYFGVAGQVAGSFSSVRGQAVVLDSLNDQLRAFSAGWSGEGERFAPGVSSPGGSGEIARLIEIGGTVGGGGAPLTGDLNGDGAVDGSDLGILLGSWGPCADCPADLNGDGVVDGSDLGELLGAWTG